MNKFELVDQVSNTVYNWLHSVEDCPWKRTVTVSRDELIVLKKQIDELELKLGNFINDDEKMRDFVELSKDEFLASYSYIYEEEYDNTELLYKANGGRK